MGHGDSCIRLVRKHYAESGNFTTVCPDDFKKVHAMDQDTGKKIVGGIAAAGMAVYAYKRIFSENPQATTSDSMALQGQPNGPLEQPGGGNSTPKNPQLDNSLRRYTPPRQSHRYWTEAPKPHHLETESYKNYYFTRIFSWRTRSRSPSGKPTKKPLVKKVDHVYWYRMGT